MEKAKENNGIYARNVVERSRVCPKFSAKTKEKAILMYLNNVGIRKIALFSGCSPATVLYWIRQKHSKLKDSPEISASEDIIELDEIYTYCSKKTESDSVDCLFAKSSARCGVYIR